MTSRGFASYYLETYFEVVVWIAERMQDDKSLANEVMERNGSNGHYELAQELADKFELLHAGRIWDGEFYETLRLFLKREEEIAQGPHSGPLTDSFAYLMGGPAYAGHHLHKDVVDDTDGFTID